MECSVLSGTLFILNYVLFAVLFCNNIVDYRQSNEAILRASKHADNAGLVLCPHLDTLLSRASHRAAQHRAYTLDVFASPQARSQRGSSVSTDGKSRTAVSPADASAATASAQSRVDASIKASSAPSSPIAPPSFVSRSLAFAAVGSRRLFESARALAARTMAADSGGGKAGASASASVSSPTGSGSGPPMQSSAASSSSLAGTAVARSMTHEHPLPLWHSVRRIVVIGVHGWAPLGGALSDAQKLNSHKFCVLMTAALRRMLGILRGGSDHSTNTNTDAHKNTSSNTDSRANTTNTKSNANVNDNVDRGGDASDVDIMSIAVAGHGTVDARVHDAIETQVSV